MFGTKKDRQIVELEIEFNLTAINKWLDKDGELEDIEKMKDWNAGDSVVEKYCIDVLPNGQRNVMYFHRKKGVFSGSVGGHDIPKGAGKIEELEWYEWREFLSVAVNRKLILSVPVREIVELHVAGKLLKDSGNYLDQLKEQKIEVPVLFDDENQPKGFVNVWRRSASKFVCYRNTLGSVTASTTSDILYWR